MAGGLRRAVDRHIVVAMGLAACAFFGSLYGLAGFADSISIKREEAQVGNALKGEVQQTEANLTGATEWDDAILHMEHGFDAPWVTAEIEHYLCGTMRFEFIYVLDARDVPVSAMRDNLSVDVATYAALRSDAAALVRSVREREVLRGPLKPPFKASGNIASPIQASALIRNGAKIMVLSATLVQPGTGKILPAGVRSPIVVSGKPIDGDSLARIAHQLLMPPLSLLPPDASAVAFVDVNDAAGQSLARIAWSPDRPGTYLVSIVLLPILAAIGLPLWLYFHSRRIATKLRLTAREREDVAASVPGVIFSFLRGPGREARFSFLSPASIDVFGLDAADVAGSVDAFLARVHPDDRRRLLRETVQSRRRRSPLRNELRYLHSQKGERWIEASSRPETKSDGSTVWHGFAADVTDRKRAEAKLRTAAAVFATTSEGMIVTDLEGTLTSINPAFTAITGYSEAEALGKNVRILRSERHDDAFFAELWRSLGHRGWWNGEIWNRNRAGSMIPQWVTIATVRDPQNMALSYVATYTDIEQLKAIETKLERLATHDTLTGLPNRMFLYERLEQSLSRASRHHRSVAVMFLDLDRFKIVNDTLGHGAGDQVLRTVSARFKSRLRETDTLARLGGDEFIILLEDLPARRRAGQLAHALIELLKQPILLEGGEEVRVGSSIGISFFPSDGDTADALISNADAALYRAKEAGRGLYRCFSDEPA